VADLLKFTKSLFQFITKQENLHHVKGSQERVLTNENKSMEERVWLYAKQVPVLMVLRLPLLVAMNEEPLLDIFLHPHRSD
jgi:hypothetical protein